MFELPPELRVALGGFLTFLLTQGLKALANLIGFDIGGWGSAIVASIVASILIFVDGIVALIPPEWQPVAGAVFGLIAAILSAFGVHYSYRNVVPA
jgi:hypothetical protein